MTSKKTKIIVDNKEIDLPLIIGTMGPPAIDIRTLSNEGLYTFDPGYLSTASCSSSITYVDGENGELLYRGYPIEPLSKKCDFLDVSYLLYNGELPSTAEKQIYQKTVNGHTLIHDQLNSVFRGFRRDAHPMAVMIGVVASMSAFYFDKMDVNNLEHRKISAERLLEKLPPIGAWSFTYSHGLPFV